MKVSAGALALAGFLALCLVDGGCSKQPRRIKVTGTVTVDGQPITVGKVLLTDSELKKDGASAQIVDGKFEFYAKEPALMKVDIRAPQPGSEDDPHFDPHTADPTTKAQRPPRVYKERLPARYNSQTTLTMKIEAGTKNEFDFPLKSN